MLHLLFFRDFTPARNVNMPDKKGGQEGKARGKFCNDEHNWRRKQKQKQKPGLYFFPSIFDWGQGQKMSHQKKYYKFIGRKIHFSPLSKTASSIGSESIFLVTFSYFGVGCLYLIYGRTLMSQKLLRSKYAQTTWLSVLHHDNMTCSS